MRSFERRLNEFRDRGVAIAAISVDTNQQSRDLAASQHYTIPLLSDPNAAAIRAYGILHPRGGVDGHDVARPAEFLLDSTGRVRWENLTESIVVRLRPTAVLAAVDRMEK